MSSPRGLARLVAWMPLIAATCWLWARDRPATGEPTLAPGLSIERDVTFRTDAGRSTRLDVYRPSSAAALTSTIRRPAILALHGGSWVGGSKDDYGPQVARLVHHGFVVFVVDYTLSRPGRPGWPAALDDARAAVRWIRAHAQEYRVDPDRVVALGASAGGHLAMLLGTDPPHPEPKNVSSRVNAVVSFYGPADLPALVTARGLPRDPVAWLLGGPPSRTIELMRSASPIDHVGPESAPTLLFHGLDDRWVPPEQSVSMANRLREVGIPCRLVLLPGARHGFGLVVASTPTRDLLPEIVQFLDELRGARPPGRP
jgi:acetyl esterase/lipase